MKPAEGAVPALVPRAGGVDPNKVEASFKKRRANRDLAEDAGRGRRRRSESRSSKAEFFRELLGHPAPPTVSARE
jgi:hypothetical protein